MPPGVYWGLVVAKLKYYLMKVGVIMVFEIIQPEDNKTNYFDRVAGFMTGKVKTTEQLESRFDVLMTEFVMTLPAAFYDAKNKVLTIS